MPRCKGKKFAEKLEPHLRGRDHVTVDEVSQMWGLGAGLEHTPAGREIASALRRLGFRRVSFFRDSVRVYRYERVGAHPLRPGEPEYLRRRRVERASGKAGDPIRRPGTPPRKVRTYARGEEWRAQRMTAWKMPQTTWDPEPGAKPEPGDPKPD